MKLVRFLVLYFYSTLLFAQIVSFNSIDRIGGGGASFSIGSMNMVLQQNGKGYLESGRKKISSFKLPVPKECYIEKLQYAVNTKDVYIIYQYTDEDAAGGFAACYDMTSNKLKWTARIPGFNIGEPLADRDYLYLTAIGWVAKLNTITGKYEWQQKNLYTDEHFYNDFEKPYFKDGTVVFKEGKSGLYSRNALDAKLLIVDNETGKIISGKPVKKNR